MSDLEMVTVARDHLELLRKVCACYAPHPPTDEISEVMKLTLTASSPAKHGKRSSDLTADMETPDNDGTPLGDAGPEGYFAEIAFLGRIEYTGYVTQVTKHGQAAYHIDLPEKLWGGNPLAWVEHAASAWFSERPVTEATVRRQWEAAVRAAAERARREAEWRDMQMRQAITAGADEDDLDDDDDEPLRWRD